MGTCGDCKYWTYSSCLGEYKDDFGECRQVTVNIGGSLPRYVGPHSRGCENSSIRTGKYFGCIHFEEKGPFSYVDVGCIGYAIRYKRSKVIGYMRPELEAEQVVDFLNEHWNKEHSCTS